MKNTFRILIIPAILLLILFGVTNFILPNTSKYRKIKANINGTVLNLEIADSNELRAKGLSGRNLLSRNTGMIFIFPEKRSYSFWMKGMKFPLDFIWIDDTVIRDLTENVPPPKTADSSDVAVVIPRSGVNKVIEVNAGTIANLKIKIGDKVKF